MKKEPVKQARKGQGAILRPRRGKGIGEAVPASLKADDKMSVKVTCRGADTAALADLIPFQGDLKHLSEGGYEKLRAAILKYGFSFPFAVWKDEDTLRIEDGHQRAKVLKRMEEDGYEIPRLPIDYIEAADEKEAKEKILLATSQYGEMNGESLNNFLMESGLEFHEIKNLLALPEIDLERFSDKYFPPETSEAPEPQIDRAAELQKKWKVKVGQIWQLGRHRILCGDSSDANTIKQFLSKSKPDGICTDPPFDIDPDVCISYFNLSGSNVAIVLSGDSLAFALAHSWDFKLDFIWKHKKPKSIKTYNMPVFYHNHCLVLTRNGAKSGWRRPNPDFGSVIEVDAEFQDNQMGHGKHPNIFMEMIRGFPWTIIYDPFLGTGATLLACERLNRTCLGVEKEPKIMAVALEYLAAADLKPKLYV